MKLVGHTAIISGSSRGLGFEIAKSFIREGANVMLCARHNNELQIAKKNLLNLSTCDLQIQAIKTDISDPAQVEQLIQQTLSHFGKIDCLVANAAIHGSIGPIESVDWQEWSNAIDINLKGTVLQCRAVLPHFKKQRAGKIMILSGGGATKPMPYLSAYAASKTGIVRFAETLAEEVRAFNIDVNAVAPGAMNTRLLDEILQAGPERVGKAYYDQAVLQQKNGGTPLEKAAQLCVFLASPQSQGISGKLISAVWDPWQTLPDYINELQTTDIYTLRRIMPNDRGKQFGECT